ncbi:UNVERIFIED_CONTAM: Serine/threonine-protein kinase BLUS1 [Sesamum radiatum]|uniref:Serine/threonine-protein kinase BLUS1 n=1 Tax=Sesamum radiatum TaxID=300843 RepID=A0AAW2T517_SESRA
MPFLAKAWIEPYIGRVLQEVLNALSYLYGQGYAHGDIKSGNILLGQNSHVFLADFGYSASNFERRPSSSANIGCAYWVPPKKAKTAMSDIWSFGITALELAHGRPPVYCLPKSKTLVKRLSTRLKLCPDMKKNFSENFGVMVEKCLQKDPAQRTTAENLLKCEFLTNNILESPDVIANIEGLSAIEGEEEEEDSELVW